MAEPTYIVTSGTFALPLGTTSTASELTGCNVAALLSGGHLALDPSTPSDDGQTDKE